MFFVIIPPHSAEMATEEGIGGLNFITEKVKIFIFTCIEVFNVTMVALLKHVSTVLNGINIS